MLMADRVILQQCLSPLGTSGRLGVQGRTTVHSRREARLSPDGSVLSSHPTHSRRLEAEALSDLSGERPRI